MASTPSTALAFLVLAVVAAVVTADGYSLDCTPHLGKTYDWMSTASTRWGVDAPCTGVSANLPEAECAAWQAGAKKWWPQGMLKPGEPTSHQCYNSYTWAVDFHDPCGTAYYQSFKCTVNPSDGILHITKIDFSLLHFPSEGVTDLAFPLEWAENLTHLEILKYGVIHEPITNSYTPESRSMDMVNSVAPIAKLTNLHTLDIQGCMRGFSLPPQWSTLTKLKHLALSHQVRCRLCAAVAAACAPASPARNAHLLTRRRLPPSLATRSVACRNQDRYAYHMNVNSTAATWLRP